MARFNERDEAFLKARIVNFRRTITDLDVVLDRITARWSLKYGPESWDHRGLKYLTDVVAGTVDLEKAALIDAIDGILSMVAVMHDWIIDPERVGSAAAEWAMQEAAPLSVAVTRDGGKLHDEVMAMSTDEELDEALRARAATVVQTLESLRKELSMHTQRSGWEASSPIVDEQSEELIAGIASGKVLPFLGRASDRAMVVAAAEQMDQTLNAFSVEASEQDRREANAEMPLDPQVPRGALRVIYMAVNARRAVRELINLTFEANDKLDPKLETNETQIRTLLRSETSTALSELEKLLNIRRDDEHPGIGHNRGPEDADLTDEDLVSLKASLISVRQIGESREYDAPMLSAAGTLISRMASRIAAFVAARTKQFEDGFYKQAGATAATVLIPLSVYMVLGGRLDGIVNLISRLLHLPV